MIKMVHRVIAGCVLGFALSGSAQHAIHLAFHNGTNTRDAMQPGAAPIAPGQRVDSQADTWNEITSIGGAGLTFSNQPLLLDNGNNSGATISGTSGYSGYDSNGWAAANKDYVMMEGWYGIRDTEFITVTNLPPAITIGGYHVIIYGDANVTSRTMNYTIDGVTHTIQDAALFSGTFSEGENFVVFTGLTNATFTVTGNPGAADARSALNGIQIIQGDPPAQAQVLFFTADDHYVSPGSNVQLAWSVTNATTVAITGLGDVTAQTLNGQGSTSIVVTATTEFTLTASNPDTTSETSLRVGAGPARPNMVFFLVDDMGWQDTSEPFYYVQDAPVVTPLNQRYRTPNMEVLADRGMKFTSAYAMPVCTPTRVCWMTGKNSAHHKVTNWTNPSGTDNDENSTTSHNSPANWIKMGLPDTLPTLPAQLQAAGYRTIHAGKAHFGASAYAKEPLNLGFDVNIAGSEIGHPGSYTGDYGQSTSRPVPGLEAYRNTGTFLTEALTQEINNAIGDAVQDGVPFFAYMAHYAVHSPFTNDPRFTAHYPTLSGGELNYATMIEGMDKSLGDILAKLDALGVAEDTLVVFMSDNGGDAPFANVNSGNAPLRHKKGSQYEGGVRVPMIAAWAEPNPANAFQTAHPIPTNSVTHDIVACFDLHPTFLETAGVSLNYEVDGVSLLPYFAGTPGTHRPQELMIYFPHDHRGDYFAILRQGPWKLIYTFANDAYALYNLEADISEANNLAASEPERVMRMARALARELNREGAQWPRFASNGNDDPYAMPSLPSVDADEDGLPDNLEDPNNNGLVDPGETDPDAADSDQDQTPDGAEVELGLDPLDNAAFFGVQAIALPNGNLRLIWPSQPGNLFRLESRSHLASGIWGLLSENVSADAAASQTTFDFAPPVGTTPAYFRAELK